MFEGPLDLLLHLIKRNEVQITDIPIATITDQYLAALEQQPALNLDGAGEYLVMAASLMVIKSRMLLPIEGDGDDEPEEDPRAELVQQLLEYQRFREVAVALGERTLLERDVFAPAGEPAESAPAGDSAPVPVRDASFGDLLLALREVLRRRRPPPTHQAPPPVLSMAEAARHVLAHFSLRPRLTFVELFADGTSVAEVVVTFLALLELIRLKVIRAVQSERFGRIELSLAVGDLEEAQSRARSIGEAEPWRGGEESDGHGDARGS
jgi:segregation and condensation protein A